MGTEDGLLGVLIWMVNFPKNQPFAMAGGLESSGKDPLAPPSAHHARLDKAPHIRTVPLMTESNTASNAHVILETNQGTITVKLFPEAAPKTTENFSGLVEKGYYDGIIFHRVIPDFMIQGGDPTGTGRGGESIWGKPFEDECSPALRFTKPGLLAMANAGPNTNGSQFFITTAATPWLDGRHTIFGEVIDGYEVVRKIESCQTGRDDRPVEKQLIEKASLRSES